MSSSNPALVVGSVVVGALAGFFGHDIITGKAGGKALPDAESNQPDTPDQAAAALRSENEQLATQVRTLREELARRPVPAPAKAATGEGAEAVSTGPDGKPVAATFDTDQLHEVLGKIDWSLVGGNMKDMVPLMAKLGEAIAAGEQPDLGAMADLQRLNADLIKVAEVISKAKVPGNGINGAFTHPVVAANQIGAALEAAGQTLDADQKTALDRVMQVFAAKDQNLRLAAGDRDLQLENLAEELEFKQAFYDQAKGLLNADQRATLFDDKVAGRTGLDLFSPGLMMAQFARPTPIKNAKEFAATASYTIKNRLKLDGDAAAQLQKVVAEWSGSYPPSYWETKADNLERNGMMKSDRIRTALNRQLALTRAILSNVNLTAEQRKQLSKSQLILVPLPN